MFIDFHLQATVKLCNGCLASTSHCCKHQLQNTGIVMGGREVKQVQENYPPAMLPLDAVAAQYKTTQKPFQYQNMVDNSRHFADWEAGTSTALLRESRPDATKVDNYFSFQGVNNG